MITGIDFFIKGPERFRDAQLSMTDIERIRQLKTLKEASLERLARLEQDPRVGKDAVLIEKAVIHSTQRELHRLERLTTDPAIH
jgi:hypothetical protein